MVLFENGKCPQTRRHAFFGDQAARLHHFPAAICRRLSIYEWKFVQGNACAIDPQFFRRATHLNETIRKRLRTGQDQRHSLEQLTQLGWIIRDIFL